MQGQDALLARRIAVVPVVLGIRDARSAKDLPPPRRVSGVLGNGTGGMSPDILKCAECGKSIPGEKAVDHGYRIGDTEKVVERWVCPECDEAIHDEAMGMLP